MDEEKYELRTIVLNGSPTVSQLQYRTVIHWDDDFCDFSTDTQYGEWQNVPVIELSSADYYEAITEK